MHDFISAHSIIWIKNYLYQLDISFAEGIHDDRDLFRMFMCGGSFHVIQIIFQ